MDNAAPSLPIRAVFRKKRPTQVDSCLTCASLPNTSPPSSWHQFLMHTDPDAVRQRSMTSWTAGRRRASFLLLGWMAAEGLRGEIRLGVRSGGVWSSGFAVRSLDSGVRSSGSAGVRGSGFRGLEFEFGVGVGVRNSRSSQFRVGCLESGGSELGFGVQVQGSVWGSVAPETKVIELRT